jgi:hypothetical protein
MALNIPWQWPLLLLVNVCWRQGEAFRSEEHKVMGGGLILVGNRGRLCRLSRILSLHFNIIIEKDVLWLNLGYNIWRAGLQWNFDVDVGRSASEAFAAT